MLLNSHIIGRKEELAALQAACDSPKPQFLAVYGRRRIGKTFLIERFFRDRGRYFELTGIKGADTKTQLGNFAREYADVFQAGKPLPPPATWTEAFDLLRKRTAEKPADEKLILFFDELPWLASPRSGFLAVLGHAWNRHLSREKNLIVVICGSAASWMIKKVLQDKGGLHGRLTGQLQMLPFTLAETRLFLEAQQIRLNPQQFIELHMAVGGVAQYLTGMQPGQSASQLIQGRYFDKNAPLKGEFHKLFSSLFDGYEHHIAIVNALAASHYGLTNEQILAKTGLSSGGTYNTVLSELRASGFITFLPQFDNRKRLGKYLLTDEFSLFYIKWAREWENELGGLEGYWQRQSNTQSFRTWAGYAFETLCIRNIAHIKEQLGIAGVTTRVSQWHDGQAQIDLVIDRDDRCINLCEIKYHSSEYTLNTKDAEALRRKKQRFLESTQTRKALFLTLITVNGAVHNTHYIDTIDSQVRANRFIG